MIPKIIHYCWFGGNPLPESAKKCIASWRKFLPDYEIKEWNESNFDVKKSKYTNEAYRLKKYAFVSDYARLCALYNEGGIYFDTDIDVKKSLTPLLNNKSFIGWEADYIGTGVMAAEPHQKWIKDVLDTYTGHGFILWSGKLNNEPNPYRVTRILKRYGLVIDKKYALLKDDIVVYPFEYLCAHYEDRTKYLITDNTYCVHQYEGSWTDKNVSVIDKILKRYTNLKVKLGIDM